MITITVINETENIVISGKKGDLLLNVLKENNINIYGTISSKLNCSGRGLCATCGVYILSKEIKPVHWHDKLAEHFGYPRLTCQIILQEDIIIKKPSGKIIWGQLLPRF